MKRYLTFALMTMLSAAAWAQFTVRSVTGAVKVEVGLEEQVLRKGMTVGKNNTLVIPAGGKVVLEDGKSTYSSAGEGRISVIRLVSEARRSSSSKTRSLRAALADKTDSRQTPKGTMAVETGRVTRALKVYDPAGDTINVDPRTLGRHVYEAIVNNRLSQAGDASLPMSFSSVTNERGGKNFSLVNTSDSPLYFNVFKISGSDAGRIEISEIGQPVGSYVVLPDQGLCREQYSALDPSDRHLIIATAYYFDIDSLISTANEMLATPPAPAPLPMLPVYVMPVGE